MIPGILDRKVMRTFLVVLTGALIAFVALFVILDLVDNLDRFIDKQAPLRAPLLYYLNYIPNILVLILPVAMLLASMSTIGGLTRDNELVAIKAGGISAYRPIASLAVLALIGAGVAFVFAETVVPLANERKQMVYNRYVEQAGPVTRSDVVNRTLDLGAGSLLYVKSYNSDARVAENIMIAESEGTSITNVVEAARMEYLGPGDSWRLHGVTTRSWTAGDERYARRDTLTRVLPAVTPEELANRMKRPEEMGYSELDAYVGRGQVRGRDVRRAQVDLHMKIALPFANFIIVLFGASLAAVRRRTGMAVGFTVSILICFTYYVVIRTGQALGYNGDLEPLAAAWLGNGIFGTLSLFFLWRARY